ncbi:hypothetical protein SAMN05421858_2406, partial [Haladaptatus litoreus]
NQQSGQTTEISNPDKPQKSANYTTDSGQQLLRERGAIATSERADESLEGASKT